MADAPSETAAAELSAEAFAGLEPQAFWRHFHMCLPANGTLIAAAEADSTGTTTLGKRVIDHSFQLPLQIVWIVTALTGIAIVAVFH